MLAGRAYLDHNATTPLRPAAAEAMIRALETCGNPSSIHAEGRAARAAIDKARQQVAGAVGGEAKNVIFTSGATEALNTLLRKSPAIVSRTHAKEVFHFIAGATEHSAVCPPHADYRPVHPDGTIDLDKLKERISDYTDERMDSSTTVALQLANSETGVIQPIAMAAALTKDSGGLFVCDAVAAFGKISIDIKALDVDAIVISAHKFGGPLGVGAIILNGDRLGIEVPLLQGGGQEMRRRSGTENVPGIVGMGVAAEEAAKAISAEHIRLSALRDQMLERFRQSRPDCVVFGETARRLPNTLCFAVPGLKAETAVINFDLQGVAISSGSACSSGKVKRSHVLDAMDVDPKLAECALRFSLGWTTTQDDIDKAIAVFAKVATARRSIAA